MPSNNTFYRNVFLGSLCLTVLILFISLVLNPASAPASVRGFDAWARAHWTLFILIIVAISIVDFVLAFDGFQTEAKKKLGALEKQVAELKSELSELNRKT